MVGLDERDGALQTVVGVVRWYVVMVGKQWSRDYLGHTTFVLWFFVLCVHECVCGGGWSIGMCVWRGEGVEYRHVCVEGGGGGV